MGRDNPPAVLDACCHEPNLSRSLTFNNRFVKEILPLFAIRRFSIHEKPLECCATALLQLPREYSCWIHIFRRGCLIRAGEEVLISYMLRFAFTDTD